VLRALDFGYGNTIPSLNSFADIGCGLGGSTRHIARKYSAPGVGLSLSTWQISKATEITNSAGLSTLLSFRVEDATQSSIPDNTQSLGGRDL